MDNKVKLNIEELKGFLKHIVDNNRFIQKKGIVPVTVNIEGDAGLGKTSAVTQLSKELGLNFVRLNLATIEELGDLVGFPIRQFQLCTEGSSTGGLKTTKTIEEPVTTMVKKMVTEMIEETRMVKKQVLENGVPIIKDVAMIVKVPKDVEIEVEETTMISKVVPVESAAVAGECIWVDEQAVEDYLKRGYSFTGEKRMSYCPPEWIAGLTGGGFLLLDDYTRADQRFLQACMTLIETQTYISWSLPEDWHILLTTNPDNGEYLVTPMDDAQKTRFISVDLKFDKDVWATWAEKQGIDGRCINFLLLHPELVQGAVNPRAITTFFNCISSVKSFSAELPLVTMIGEGSVGSEFTSMFAMFINNNLDKLISPHDLLTKPDDKALKQEIIACTHKDKAFRADIASVLTTRLINYTISYAEKNTIPTKMIDRLVMLCTDLDIFTDDLRYYLVKKVLNGNKQKFQAMIANDKVAEMAMR